MFFTPPARRRFRHEAPKLRHIHPHGGPPQQNRRRAAWRLKQRWQRLAQLPQEPAEMSAAQFFRLVRPQVSDDLVPPRRRVLRQEITQQQLRFVAQRRTRLTPDPLQSQAAQQARPPGYRRRAARRASPSCRGQARLVARRSFVAPGTRPTFAVSGRVRSRAPGTRSRGACHFTDLARTDDRTPRLPKSSLYTSSNILR